MNLSKLKMRLRSVDGIKILVWLISLGLTSCQNYRPFTINPGLRLSINKQFLVGEEESFVQVKFCNTSSPYLRINLEDCRFIAEIETIGGSAEAGSSFLSYTDAQGKMQSKTAINQPLSHFFKNEALIQRDNSENYLPLNIQIKPGLGVTGITITFKLYDTSTSNNLAPQSLIVNWIEPVTAFFIQALEIVGFRDFTGDELIQFWLRNKERNNIKHSDVILKLESSNAAEFEFMNHRDELVGKTIKLHELLGNNRSIKSKRITPSPIRLQLTNAHGQASAKVNISIQQNLPKEYESMRPKELICQQSVSWNKEMMRLGLAATYNPNTKKITCQIKNTSKIEVNSMDGVELSYHSTELHRPSPKLNSLAKLSNQGMREKSNSLPLVHIPSEGTVDIDFDVDLMDEKIAKFMFLLTHQSKLISTAVLTCQEDVKLNLDILYDPNDPNQWVSYQITNQGNDPAKKISLSYQAKEHSSRIDNQSRGSIQNLAIPGASQASMGLKSDKLGKIDFGGNQSATFDFVLDYGDTQVKISKVFVSRSLDLVIKQLTYDPKTQKIYYTVLNQGTDDVLLQDQLKLKYENKAYNNKVALQAIGKEAARSGTIDLERIPAKQVTQGSLDVDLKGESNAEFIFTIYDKSRLIGIPVRVNCQEIINLELVTLHYNPTKHTIQYEVQNKGVSKSAKHVFLQYICPDGTTLAQKNQHNIDLGQIDPQSAKAGTLKVDLGKKLQASFTFKLFYGNTTEALDTQYVGCNIQLKINNLTFDSSTNQVTFEVINTGNCLSTSPITLIYRNADSNNQARIIGNASIKTELKPREISTPHQLQLDLKGEKQATFEFELIYGGHTIGKATHTFTKEIRLKLELMPYNPGSNEVHYQVVNQGNQDIIDLDKVSLRFRNVQPSNNASLRASKGNWIKTGTIELKQIKTGDAQSGILMADLGTQPMAKFEFQLYYNDNPIADSKQVLELTNEIKIDLPELLYKAKDKKIFYSIYNSGATEITPGKVKLKFKSQDVAKLQMPNGNITTEGIIELGKIAPNDSITGELPVILQGSAESFEFSLLYGEDPTPKQTKTVNCGDINLKIIGLKFDTVTNEVIFNIANTGDSDLNKLVTVSYENMDLNNKAKLKLVRKSVASIMANGQAGQQKAGIEFNNERKATFNIILIYEGKKVDQKPVTCKVLPAIILETKCDKLEGSNTSFTLTLINNNPFNLYPTDLKDIRLSYQATMYSKTLKPHTLKSKLGKQDVHGVSLSELLKNPKCWEKGANQIIELELDPKEAGDFRWAISLEGDVKPMLVKKIINWKLGAPDVSLTCQNTNIIGQEKVVLEITNNAKFALDKQMMKNIILHCNTDPATSAHRFIYHKRDKRSTTASIFQKTEIMSILEDDINLKPGEKVQIALAFRPALAENKVQMEFVLKGVQDEKICPVTWTQKVNVKKP